MGVHLDAEIRRRGHETAPIVGELDVVIQVGPEGVRVALDAAFARGARLFLYLSTGGLRGEDRVRAAGLPWIVVRPEIMWGPGDSLTRELAWLVRHLPFVPRPGGGPRLAPISVEDVAAALLDAAERPELWNQTWTLAGPEELGYGDVVARVAHAVAPEGRRQLPLPAWLLPLRRLSRPRPAPPLPFAPARFMTIEALRAYLGPPGEHLHIAT